MKMQRFDEIGTITNLQFRKVLLCISLAKVFAKMQSEFFVNIASIHIKSYKMTVILNFRTIDSVLGNKVPRKWRALNLK